MFLIVRTASDQDVYAKDRGIAHNPRETEEHKEVRPRVLRVASDSLPRLGGTDGNLSPRRDLVSTLARRFTRWWKLNATQRRGLKGLS